MLKSEWKSHSSKDTQNFWTALDKLVSESHVVIDCPRGSVHPKYQNIVYPIDYGYLDNTTSMDAGGIDVWCGSTGTEIDGIICIPSLVFPLSPHKEAMGESL